MKKAGVTSMGITPAHLPASIDQIKMLAVTLSAHILFGNEYLGSRIDVAAQTPEPGPSGNTWPER